MVDRDAVCVLIPTYNEAATIGDIVRSFREQGYDRVLVVDGHSTDGTRELAREAGATVVTQSGRGQGAGKGQAVREGLATIEREYVLMLDGDGTYDPDAAADLLAPLFAGRAQHVVGNRRADIRPGAMTRLNRFGNWMVNHGFRIIHGQQMTDILSGYRAFTLESARELTLTEDGFGIETEMSVECVKHGQRVEVVPITYRPRPDDSQTNLHPFRDGAVIVLTLYRMAKTSNPLFYFGSVGGLGVFAGVVLAVYVAADWFLNSVSHEVIALASAFLLLLGVQLLIFGFLSDMIVTLHREQLQRIDSVRASVQGDERMPDWGVTTADTMSELIADEAGGEEEAATDGGDAGSDPSSSSDEDRPQAPSERE
jgi:glycosyltransferase (TIGR04182 family)